MKSIWDALRNSGKVIDEGLINPNKFNKPAADRFKSTILPMLGVPGAIAETADELNKGNPGMAALAATGAIPGVGFVGSILRKGIPKLLLTHGTNDFDLYRLLSREADKSLSAPSMAVSKLENPFAGNVTLYPDPTKFDPATNIRSDMWGRDAFTYRRDQGGTAPYAKQKYRKDAKLTEHYIPTETSKLAAVLASPKFSSFSQFEASPTGAATLSDARLNAADFYELDEALRGKLRDWLPGHKGVGSLESLSASDRKVALRELMNEDPELLSKVMHSPSEYAELKYHGKVPIDREHISAVRLRDRAAQENRALVNALRKQGIPIIPSNLRTQDEIAAFVDNLTGLRKLPSKDALHKRTFEQLQAEQAKIDAQYDMADDPEDWKI